MKRRDTLIAALALTSWGAQAQSALPDAVQRALRSAKLPASALAVWIAPVGSAKPRLAWRADQAHNPASLAKLTTTFAALEQLGPAWRWRTPVWLTGKLDPASGVLDGDVVIKGSGDPSLVLERVWLLLRRIQGYGVKEVRGDFVLDSSAFVPEPQSPGDFDGEPWRAGNVRPDALLFNFKSHVLSLQPDPANGVAWVRSDTGMPLQANVPLKPGACTDPRGSLRANWLETPGKVEPLKLAGVLPTECGPQTWPLADANPATYNHRLLETLWREAGGKLGGRVRDGQAPGTPFTFEWTSPTLAEVVRDINKFSNNVMAEQLWLSVALQAGDAPATTAQARQRHHDWLAKRLGWPQDGFELHNGSGLSRSSRLTAQQLAQLLQAAWASPLMPELAASLPLAGQDGTLTRDPGRFGQAVGRAHLKTGSLRDVAAVAGYVTATAGQRYVLVAMLEHPQAAAGRAALEALIRWTVDGP